ncbi:unnamed protein product [Ceutorhynchus assimilis]|uniref:Ankyrin repeat domain-containing protein n=1 Tax=Ceutorhynchus assimilis TaxID=467358 RepID=A0A9N9MY35_9CUCU|nr:unnamed protein product [Ceutorhynchus assimilis]
MVDCVQTSATIKANSQAFFYNLKKTDFALKNGTKGFLLENDGSILCLETTDVDVTRVLLAQVLINFKKDSILRDNLNEIIFTDFGSFNTLSLEEIEDFQKNFPDLFVCILDNEEQLGKQPRTLESWINIIKANGKKIIFIVKNSKPLEKIIMDYEMTNIFKLKLDTLLKENETLILSKNETICEVENNLANNENELTSARALDEDTNVNIKEEVSNGLMPSHGEAPNEDADLKKLLQSLGVKKLDAIDPLEGNTQLHFAARNGRTETVKSLLIHGAMKDIKNNCDQTALHLAVENGYNAIVHILLEHGFNVNAADNKQQTSLIYACNWHSDPHLIRILLKFGAEMEIKDFDGRTALHWASLRGHTAVVNSLLENGANVNAQINDGETPLHLATLCNRQQVVLTLLQHGALYLSIKNKQQESALDIAKKWNRTKILQIFKSYKSCRNSVSAKSLYARWIAEPNPDKIDINYSIFISTPNPDEKPSKKP